MNEYLFPGIIYYTKLSVFVGVFTPETQMT